MKFFELLLQSGFVQALGWTLIHSIWQVACLSFLLMVVLAFLRKRPAEVRYRVALGALAATVLLSAATFLVCYYYIVPGDGGGSFLEGAGVLPQGGTSSGTAVPALSGGLLGLFTLFARNLYLMVALWAAGVVLLSCRFACGLWYLHRLRREAQMLHGHWARQVDLMARRTGIRRMVKLAESALVKVPMMIGHLKPLILVPAGMLAALPPDQVEAILAHELGHIRRNDFLVNLLQSVAEILYFFHPGVWWISGVVRRERELCCDDAAMRQGCHPVTLAFALSEVGEMAHSTSTAYGRGRNELSRSELSLAFAAERGERPLLARIKRLLGQESAGSPGVLPAVLLAAGLALALLLTGAGRVFSSPEPAGSGEVLPGDRLSQTTVSGTPVVTPSPHAATVLRQRRPANAGDTVGPVDSGKPAAPVAPGKPAAPAAARPPAAPSVPSVPSVQALPKEVPPVPKLSPAPAAPELAPLPELEIPPAPAHPAPVPPLLDSAVWGQLGEQMKGVGKATGDLVSDFFSGSDSTGRPWKFHLDGSSAEDFGKAMEKFGEQMGKWGETFGEHMEAWAKANKPKLKQFELELKQWEKDNQPKLEAFEEQMKEWEKKNKPLLDQYGREMEQWQKDNQFRLKEHQRKMEKWQEKMKKLEEKMKELRDEQG